MRFCMITTFYPPYSFGGDAFFVQHLGRALARRGHDVRDFTLVAGGKHVQDFQIR